MRSHWFITSVPLLVVLAATPAVGQEHLHPQQPPAAEHQHEHGTATGLFTPRDASGTAWLPRTTDMYALHQRAGAWELMWHGNAFLQLLHEAANEHRGSTQ